ncbi:MAG: 30S ribosomal protein S6 [Lentisphaeria bacterium]|nr:30S ribosomal protein S6 [Lentisphaeria bacterium]
MTKYEAVFILDSRKLEDNGQTFAKSVQAHIKSLDGVVVKDESLGRKQFARPIGKHRAGVYWDFIMEIGTDKVLPFQDRYRLDEVVLRLQLFSYETPPPQPPRKDDGMGDRSFDDHRERRFDGPREQRRFDGPREQRY